MNYSVFRTPSQNRLAGSIHAFARFNIPAIPGAVDYTQQTGDGRIPELFSRIYRDKFYDAVCAANITI